MFFALTLSDSKSQPTKQRSSGQLIRSINTYSTSIQILKPCVLKRPLLEKYSKDFQKILLILHFITTIPKKFTYFLDNLACHFLNVSF